MMLQGEIVGKLEPDLVPNNIFSFTVRMVLATAQERIGVPVSLAPEDRVFIGKDYFQNGKETKLALVELVEGGRFLFADVDQNGTFQENERFIFEGPNLQILLKLPRSRGPYPYYPVRLSIPRADRYAPHIPGEPDGE